MQTWDYIILTVHAVLNFFLLLSHRKNFFFYNFFSSFPSADGQFFFHVKQTSLFFLCALSKQNKHKTLWFILWTFQDFSKTTNKFKIQVCGFEDWDFRQWTSFPFSFLWHFTSKLCETCNFTNLNKTNFLLSWRSLAFAAPQQQYPRYSMLRDNSTQAENNG